MLLVLQALTALSAWSFAARAWPDGRALERATLAAVLVPGLSVLLVTLLGAAGLIAPLPYALAVVAVSAAAGVVVRGAPLALLRCDLESAGRVLGALRREPLSIAALLAGAVPVLLAALATYLCVPWAWDALGYHLPIVHDAMATGTLRDVPAPVSYVSTYPHFVDLTFVAFRLGLSDDRWVELAQLPFVPAGLFGIALLAARAGVPTHRALAIAAPFLALPVVMLQLATNYVDVAVACLALSAFALAGGRGRASLLGAALALGMLLGSKPSSPPLVVLGLAYLAFRAHREHLWRWAPLALALTLGIGGGTFARNIVEHGNPTWPVQLRLGPLVLPGEVPVDELARQGLSEPYRSMSWLGRLVSSWTTLWPELPVFDQRIGGLGPVFLLLLLPSALALAFLLRDRALRGRIGAALWPLLLLGAGSLVGPAAYWTRYILALPGILLAALAITIELVPRARVPALGALILGSAFAIAITLPGLTSNGPSLLSLLGASEEERASSVALDTQELDWLHARESIPPGGAFGYDECFGLMGRLVRSDGANRVVYFDRTRPSIDELDAWLRAARVHVVVLGEGWNAPMARQHPERLRERFRSLYPAWQPCAVFDVVSDR